MNLNGLDLNLLVALDALLEEQSVTRAGERLHLSQSAMSGALARLREHFGDPLLAPLGRKLKRSALGDALVAPVRAILMQITAVFEAGPVFDPASSSRCFKVMASDYGSTVLVSEFLRRIKDRAPRVGVEVIPFADSPAQSLEEGDLDALIISREFLSPNHPSELLFTDTFACVAWDGNPNIGKRIAIAQFLDSGHVVVKYGKHGIAHIEERFFQRAGYKRRVEVTVTSFSAVPRFIVGTYRIAMMHKRLATLYAQTMPLRVLPPPINTPVLEQSMQWHAYRNDDPGGAWFREELRQAARALPGATLATRTKTRKTRKPAR
ncbi:MAG: transcriptional regulator, LysR family [Betaproteobacteria bacterium]|nr:transcriptional regulator, LysR family [Betaproteobacteria bacterium]